ncbi:hypothetical protein NIES2100_29180 [Calothrix sp. NIES-2100]|nr:hypothetical protein NIES2100_29180 [Calothrix sp. NIES-2100]
MGHFLFFFLVSLVSLVPLVPLVPPKFCSSFAQRLPLGEDVGVRAASPLGEARRSYLATAALTPDTGAQTSLLVSLIPLSYMVMINENLSYHVSRVCDGGNHRVFQYFLNLGIPQMVVRQLRSLIQLTPHPALVGR